MLLPGVDLHKIVDGRTLGDLWQFYTVNVKYLGSLTHEQFCKEFPEAAQEIERASAVQEKLTRLLEATDGGK